MTVVTTPNYKRHGQFGLVLFRSRPRDTGSRVERIFVRGRISRISDVRRGGVLLVLFCLAGSADKKSTQFMVSGLTR